MDFGIIFANTGPFAEPEATAAFARQAEGAGFESLWTVEHVVVPAGYESTYPYDPSGRMPGNDDAPIPDPLIWLSYLAAVTSRIKLATGILIVPQRNPLVLAKQLATLDALSGGRMEFGIGVGWLEEEFDALGVPFDDRGRRTDDYVAAMRALWADEQATHHGEFTRFENCVMRPQPVGARYRCTWAVTQMPPPAGPVASATGSSRARAITPSLGRLFDVARAAATEAGNDPDQLVFTSGGNGAVGSRALDEVKALADLGVSRVVLPAFLFWQDTEAALARYGAEVIARAP